MEKLTPMMKQYQQIKRKHPEMLLFFRLGDFYELFFEDAVVASRELEITLTSRNTDREGRPIPMCGVPHHAAEQYLARLIRKGYKVAICDQVEDPKEAKGIVRREVTRIVTPGTVVEEGVLEAKENNFLAALWAQEAELGVAFLDLSTGEFLLTEFWGEESWERGMEELLRFAPRELLLPEGRRQEWFSRLPRSLREESVATEQPDWTFHPEYGERILLEHFRVATLEGFGVKGRGSGVAAAGALLSYVRETQKSSLGHLTQLRYFEPGQELKLDETTVRNLELVKGLDGNRRWTLLSVLDYTRTPMGGRLLRRWILRPSLQAEVITRRLDAVEELLGEVRLRDQAGKLLGQIHDLERLLSRVAVQTANARDLLALRDSLEVLPPLWKLFSGCRSPLLCEPPDLLQDVYEELRAALAEDPPAGLHEGGLIRPGHHPELDELREMARDGRSFLASLESRERERTGIPSLKVKYNKVFGYFIEVTKTHLESVPDDYIRKQTLVGSERYVTPELKEWEEKILGAQERIFELERELFCRLREAVAAQAARIRRTAEQVARLDVLLSLAEAAHRHHYVRPEVDSSCRLEIRGGRHPVLEREGGEPFVPNDLYCDREEHQLLILTGPNMGGKSTYLRQTAHIVILAQMGSFVPAERARIGLVDRIFTRVGASDNLARGHSTFMVEMIETANILNTATGRSLILLDEVGRGTATFDGLSIAWAVAEYLLTEEKCRARTLFATHYQELTQLEQLFPGVKNYCVTVRESGNRIIFFHRVQEGIASRSYGIEVARLAGLPPAVVERARHILSRLERKEMDLVGRSRSRGQELVQKLQGSLF